MVVGDDQVDAQLFGVGGLLHGGDAVVHRDDQGIALVRQLFQHVLVHAVAALGAQGQFAAHLRAQVGEILVQNGGGGDAVHVVVAVNDDGLAVLHGAVQPLHRLVHIPDGKRIGQGRFPLQQRRGLLRRLAAPRGQHPRKQPAAAGLLQSGRRLLIQRLRLPDAIPHGVPHPSPVCRACRAAGPARGGRLWYGPAFDRQRTAPKSLAKPPARPSWRSMASSVSISVETSIETSCKSVSYSRT